MAKAVTLVLAGFVAGVLAVIGLVAITPQLIVSADTAAVQSENVDQQPEFYGE